MRASTKIKAQTFEQFDEAMAERRKESMSLAASQHRPPPTLGRQDVLDAVVTLADFLGVSIYSADKQGVIRVEPDELGRFLRSARNTSGLTQNQVASAVGMDTHASIHNYESGIVSPTVSRLQELAALYGYEIQVGFLKK